ncbi:hypothetical protein [Bradyrhizobium sp. G127]|uniref:hypothetical protein n=1 Tax=Bradyrhizobium sp. G127 TaxID=2904800 RepID=UPI001F2EC2AC|nr:hypothetical protein [Bradyrhizobium sp. G127]MCF2523584.1 hypothetical protein [Bradyrhizobium sp. G127]
MTAPRQHRDPLPMPDSPKTPHDAEGGLSAHGLSTVRKQMVEFDDLPREVRSALSSADQPSEQMIDVLCAMHRGGFPVADMLKVIAASNAKSGG